MIGSSRWPRFQTHPSNNDKQAMGVEGFLKRKSRKRRDRRKGQNFLERPSLGDKRKRSLQADKEDT